jgi:hypothetical protein
VFSFKLGERLPIFDSKMRVEGKKTTRNDQKRPKKDKKRHEIDIKRPKNDTKQHKMV